MIPIANKKYIQIKDKKDKTFSQCAHVHTYRPFFFNSAIDPLVSVINKPQTSLNISSLPTPLYMTCSYVAFFSHHFHPYFVGRRSRGLPVSQSISLLWLWRSFITSEKIPTYDASSLPQLCLGDYKFLSESLHTNTINVSIQEIRNIQRCSSRSIC